MTNPTARHALRDIASANGWIRHGINGTWDRDRFVRDGVTVDLRFGAKGALASGERSDGAVTGASGKRPTVTAWLTD